MLDEKYMKDINVLLVEMDELAEEDEKGEYVDTFEKYRKWGEEFMNPIQKLLADIYCLEEKLKWLKHFQKISAGFLIEKLIFFVGADFEEFEKSFSKIREVDMQRHKLTNLLIKVFYAQMLQFVLIAITEKLGIEIKIKRKPLIERVQEKTKEGITKKLLFLLSCILGIDIDEGFVIEEVMKKLSEKDMLFLFPSLELIPETEKRLWEIYKEEIKKHDVEILLPDRLKEVIEKTLEILGSIKSNIKKYLFPPIQ
ncbi:MAG: hypothetical protein ACO2PO_08600 [Candidatus Calescibacterium sp.]|jgi:hypothetical protein